MLFALIPLNQANGRLSLSQALTWGNGTNEMGTIPGISGCEQGSPCDCDCTSPFNQFDDQYKCPAC
eukprot:CAMPEP_0184310710 /NCGR_PEP_ID=MMETSP1049-20130417/34086_1 /TAXON_ID=77928 /ORGANISM="Proteomonas sulcata, Strain CCMP704" /LENGTH=65 /DNA_ID=CAMNT_0026625279 /DNA_START=96 /DNA_END=293 /DNA_ORIENTATION=+